MRTSKVRGFTLVEVLSALMVMSFVMVMVLYMIGYSFDEVSDDVKRSKFSNAQRELESVLVNELRSSSDLKVTNVGDEYVLKFNDRNDDYIYVRINGRYVSLSRDGIDYNDLFEIDNYVGGSIVVENQYLEIKYRSLEGVDFQLGYYLEDVRVD